MAVLPLESLDSTLKKYCVEVASPLTRMECEVTSVASNMLCVVVALAKFILEYMILLEAGSLVIHATIVDVALGVEIIEDNIGGMVSGMALVVNVLSLDAAMFPEESVDFTLK